ncbi:armadillo-type protein [Mycena sp. CBHHK59/15]|nr:armadillo-type protein [Mycena sp. CBHHK59/15]
MISVFFPSHSPPNVQQWIMHALSNIGQFSEAGVRAVVNAEVLARAKRLLQSPNHNVLQKSCWMLGNLAHLSSLKKAVLDADLCPQLVLLSGGIDIDVQEQAAYALACMSDGSKDGATAIINANTLTHVINLVGSQHLNTQKWTCYMLQNIAQHKALQTAVVDMNPCTELAELLSNHALNVRADAIYALAHISSNSYHGAWNIVHSGALDHVLELLESKDPYVLKWTCCMVANVARHESLHASITAIHPCVEILSLLQHADSAARAMATYALACISKWPGSKRRPDIFPNVAELHCAVDSLDSLNPDVLNWACWTVGKFAKHDPLNAVVLPFEMCVRLVSILL